MGEIRIHFISIYVKNIADALSTLRIDDEDIASRFVWDEYHPDYVIVDACVYSDSECASAFLRHVRRWNPITVFISGEAIAPDFNLFDYTATWDCNLSFMDRAARLPFKFGALGETPSTENNIRTIDEAKSLLREKRGFCNFIYTNRKAHPFRDNLFRIISSYRKVDSLGRHINNVNALITDRDGSSSNWFKIGIELKSAYKFSIASENASYGGYTTEKLTTSFLAHTVPIYWGNKFVCDEFNPEAFVDCGRYSSPDEIVRRVQEIDRDDDLWAYMVSRPWQTPQQIAAQSMRLEDFRQFVAHIFTQPLSEARRRPEGTFADICWENFAGGRSALWKNWRRLTRPRLLRRVANALHRKLFVPHRVTIDDFLKEHTF